MPAGFKVYVGACSGPWCKVSWSGHSGYAGKSKLAIGAAPAPRVAARAVYPPPGEIVPIYPPYPYRSGYYPKVDGISTFRPIPRSSLRSIARAIS